MSENSVSVVVAVKNGERFLAAALDSIAAQTVQPLEILVVDGDSVDQTKSIALSRSGVRVVPQTGAGIANAYNTGIRASAGELVAFLSHDDLWLPDKLKMQIECLRKNPQALLAVCQAEFFLDDPAFVPPGFRPELLTTTPVARIMETLLARRRAFDEIGFFDESLVIAEDVDWFARAADLGAVVETANQVLVRKRIHQTNAHLQAAGNNRDLLRAVKNSIERKKLRNSKTAEQ